MAYSLLRSLDKLGLLESTIEKVNDWFNSKYSSNPKLIYKPEFVSGGYETFKVSVEYVDIDDPTVLDNMENQLQELVRRFNSEVPAIPLVFEEREKEKIFILGKDICNKHPNSNIKSLEEYIEWTLPEDFWRYNVRDLEYDKYVDIDQNILLEVFNRYYDEIKSIVCDKYERTSAFIDYLDQVRNDDQISLPLEMVIIACMEIFYNLKK
jgi:hypothetical protein